MDVSETDAEYGDNVVDDVPDIPSPTCKHLVSYVCHASWSHMQLVTHYHLIS